MNAARTLNESNTYCFCFVLFLFVLAICVEAGMMKVENWITSVNLI